jgi:hypothetical protein
MMRQLFFIAHLDFLLAKVGCLGYSLIFFHQTLQSNGHNNIGPANCDSLSILLAQQISAEMTLIVNMIGWAEINQ